MQRNRRREKQKNKRIVEYVHLEMSSITNEFLLVGHRLDIRFLHLISHFKQKDCEAAKRYITLYIEHHTDPPKI